MGIKTKFSKKLKILIFDIETSPVLAYIWRTGNKIRISHEQIKKGQKFDIICICWKWHGEKRIHSLHWGIKKQNSAKMIDKFSKIVAKADITLAHNGDHFDVKQINTQRLLHGQDPIDWPITEDTLKQFRKYFALPSYKLDYISKLLGDDGKNAMVLQDWVDILETKDKDKLTKMIKYCKVDVKLLDNAYTKAEKFFAPKLNIGLLNNTGRYSCPKCGSPDYEYYGIRVNMASIYRRKHCKKCGHTYRGESVK